MIQTQTETINEVVNLPTDEGGSSVVASKMPMRVGETMLKTVMKSRSISTATFLP